MKYTYEAFNIVQVMSVGIDVEWEFVSLIETEKGPTWVFRKRVQNTY